MKPWESFYRSRLINLFEHSKTVVDIGGSLKLSKTRGNRYDPPSWLLPFVERVEYKIMDPVDTYHPDIVGDIHNLPFADNSQDAIVCISVLEHIEDPIKACAEMYRVLKPGGKIFAYAPFLYYYHAEQGYYGDYYRYTEDSLKYLFREYKELEICPVRGAIQTLIRLSPLGRWKVFEELGYILDKLTGKSKSKQVSGYNLYATK